MAIGIMLVLTIALTTVAYLTTSGTQDAQRTNAGQQATALAEAGINNALAVLKVSYPQNTYPGPAGWLGCGSLLPSTVTTLPGGTVTWSGCLVQAPTGSGWHFQWNLTATGDAKNPSGPAASDVKRTLTAVVPVVIPTFDNRGSGNSAINYLYAATGITLRNQFTVEAPVYTPGTLSLSQQAQIAETIPPSTTSSGGLNTVAAATIALANQAQIGHVNSNKDPAGDLATIYTNNCNGHAGVCNPNNPYNDPAWALTQTTFPPSTSSPDYVNPPTLTCCAPVPYNAPVDGTSHPAPAGQTSYMGFWYQAADLGPYSGCNPATSSVTGTATLPVFDTNGVMDQSAYSTGSPFVLTPSGGTYKCISYGGTGELAWDGTTLTIKGVVFIDGSATISGTGSYVGTGDIILTGTFSMGIFDTMCVQGALSGGSCNLSYPWNPANTSLGIIAVGDDGSGDSVFIKKSNFQGLLMAALNLTCDPATGTQTQGPLISVYGSLSCGQKSTLAFPAIPFPSSGFSGSTGPLPQAQLLPPLQYGGG